jgi:alkylhydroperoxidase/carboxymuconolactone decarboxylase family protein YurZ
VLRLTGTDRAVAEIAAIAEHVASLTAAAAAFQLRPDYPESERAQTNGALVALVDEDEAAEATSTLSAIRAWSQESLGFTRAPAVWRALAHQPRLLDATWSKDRLVFGPGALGDLVKICVALAVAQFRQSQYWISYFTQLLRRSNGFDDRAVVELAGAVMHYVSFNTIAHGMRLDAPVAEITADDCMPGGHLEHIVPGVKRRVTPRS